MRTKSGLLACAAFVLSLPACTSLNIIHDPQFGAVSREQLPGLIKSLRCELRTFFAANWERRDAYARSSSSTPGVKYAFFPIDAQKMGGIFLDLKVVDTVGVGAGDVNITQRDVIDSTHNRSWIVGPTLNTQNTYGLTYTFVIDQSQDLARVASDDPFQCFDSVKASGHSFESLAFEGAPDAAMFTRIRVNGTEPLAAWLVNNSVLLWKNYWPDDTRLEIEQIVPVQMNYSFAVQVTGGINVRYSLISPTYNPLQVGGGLSSVQTSTVSLYFNGVNAETSSQVKQGTAANLHPKPGRKTEDGRPGPRPRVIQGLLADKAVKEAELTRALKDTGHTPDSFRSLSAVDKSRLPQSVQDVRKDLSGIESALKRERARGSTATGRRMPDYSRGYLQYPPIIQVVPGVPGSPGSVPGSP